MYWLYDKIGEKKKNKLIKKYYPKMQIFIILLMEFASSLK